MTTRPRLATRIPFWGLVIASLGSAAAGVVILVERLGVMTTTLTDGTATGVEVYVGQSLAVLGAVLLGAGVVGILLALAIASLASLRPAAPVEVVEPADAADELDDSAAAGEHGYERGLGYTSQFEAVDAEADADATPAAASR